MACGVMRLPRNSHDCPGDMSNVWSDWSSGAAWECFQFRYQHKGRFFGWPSCPDCVVLIARTQTSSLTLLPTDCRVRAEVPNFFKDYGSDNVLPNQSYHVLRAAVINLHGAIVEWWSVRRQPKEVIENLLQCHVVHQEPYKSSGIEPKDPRTEDSF
jgi:hypothetical protein